VNGTVTLKLFKGNVIVTGRSSKDSLFDAKIVTFEDDQGAYNQADAGGFIKLNALRMRIAASKSGARTPKVSVAKAPVKAKAPADKAAAKADAPAKKASSKKGA